MRLKLLSTAAVAAALAAPAIAAAADGPGKITLTNEPGAVVKIGTTVVVSGTTDAQYVAQTVLMANRKPVDAKQGSGDYSLKWETANAGIGDNDLEVAVIGANGSRRVISRMRVTVVSGEPVRISLAEPAAGFARPVQIRVETAPGYQPEKARLIVDGEPEKRELPIVNGVIEWDISRAASGDHTLSIAARDYDGRIAHSAPIKAAVPPRFAAKVPGAAAITKDSPDIAVGITVPDGIEVAKIRAWVDVLPPVEIESRAGVIKLPALDLASGKHEVRAEMVTAKGEVYKQGPFSILIDNQYAAALAATEAAERARDEAAQKAREQALEQPAEKKNAAKLTGGADEQGKAPGPAAFLEAARLSSTGRLPSRSGPAKSAGAIGTVRGLSMQSGDDASEMGGLFTITVKLAKGSGGIVVNGDAVGPDFAPAMEAARKAAVAYIKKQGRNVDISNADIQISFESAEAKGGASAGAAAAAAIVSYLLKVPVRADVTVTGAIREDGTLTAVGSPGLAKAEALRDPSLLTLVVPPFRQSLEEALSLSPKLLVSHRIVAAKDLGQVLRQALSGYDEGSLAKANSFFTQGIANYAAGKAAAALSYLDRARQVTPEDLTIPVWISAIKKSAR